MQLRIILTNTRYMPSREEIITVDRQAGEAFFSDYNIEWAGYIVLEDTMCLSAQFLLETDDADSLLDHIECHDLPGYKVAVFVVDEEEMEELQVV